MIHTRDGDRNFMEETIYFYPALIGGLAVLIQIVLQLVELFGDVEAGDAGHGDALFGFLSFKALSAFCGLFGLAGLVMMRRSDSAAVRLSVAAGAGFAGVFLVGIMLRGLARLTASGTLDLADAAGREASVYLRVPGRCPGAGKVTVEVEAVTDGPEIPTGSRGKVLEVVGNGTLRVGTL